MNISRVSNSSLVSKTMFVDREVIFRLGSRSVRPQGSTRQGRATYRGIQANGLSLTIDARTVLTQGLVFGKYYKAKAAGNEALRENGLVVNVSELFDVQPIEAAEFDAIKEATVITYSRPMINLETGEVGAEGDAAPSLDD
jgi:hypothetical protein